MVYTILERSDSTFSSFLHNRGYEFEGRHFKLFTFSQILFEKKRVEKDRIINLGERVEWLISSPKDEFVQHFVDGLFERPKAMLAENTIVPERVETVARPEFTGCDRFTCLSPITISTKVERNDSLHLRYLSIDEVAFAEKIKDNLTRKYRLLYGKPPDDGDFTMEFGRDYIKANKKVSRLIKFKGIDIRGYMLPFVLKGVPELIKIGYECGFGDKNSLGFGMVKMA